jgi:transcriptional regulator with XRE-family HTH domain
LVIAGLAGMSKSQLDRIERGEVTLDKLSEIVALANALQISPSELMRLPVPAPANGETDSAVEAVRSALMAVGRNRPDELVVPLDALRARVMATLGAHYSCRQDNEVGAALPDPGAGVDGQQPGEPGTDPLPAARSLHALLPADAGSGTGRVDVSV